MQTSATGIGSASENCAAILRLIMPIAVISPTAAKGELSDKVIALIAYAI